MINIQVLIVFSRQKCVNGIEQCIIQVKSIQTTHNKDIYILISSCRSLVVN